MQAAAAIQAVAEPSVCAMVPVLLARVLLVGAVADLSTVTLFTHGERNDCTCIREPVLLLAGETLVAFAACTPSAGDNCQPLHPEKPPPGSVHRQIYKRSSDGGATWTALTNAPELGGSPVALHNGTLLLLTNTALWRSEDSAATWTRGGNISGFSGRRTPLMIQLSAAHPSHPGRLLAVRPTGEAVNAVSSWSDDEGYSWHGSTTQQALMDESELVELADGSVAMLSRNWLNCSSIPDNAPCREHQDGPCMCTAIAISVDSGESFTGPSVPVPSLAGANCHSAALTIGNSTYFSSPKYSGAPRLPNPPHAPCSYDPVSKRTGHCYTDRAPNRINGTIMVSASSSVSGVQHWSVHSRVTIGSACSTEAECDQSVGFGYSSLSRLPATIWPNHLAVAFETTSPDCGYDPTQRTGTGIGSATSACKIVMAMVPLKVDDMHHAGDGSVAELGSEDGSPPSLRVWPLPLRQVLRPGSAQR